MNREFRGLDKATDVLSFPAEMPGPEKIAGDLAISVETARKQAAACGHSLGTEIKVLMLHGLLHLAGYDHESDSGQMRRREQQLRARLGLPLGLIERVQAAAGKETELAAKRTEDAPPGLKRPRKKPIVGDNRLAGPKGRANLAAVSARLKSCPDTKHAQIGVLPQPVKARINSVPAAAQPKLRPDTKRHTGKTRTSTRALAKRSRTL
jgi:probable rRNA maturation factor